MSRARVDPAGSAVLPSRPKHARPDFVIRTGCARVRPEVVVFDVVETLASLDPVAARLSSQGLPPEVLGRWFTRLLRDGMALTAAGAFAGFAEVASSALQAELRGVLTEGQIATVVAGFGELTPHPDAQVAIEAARAAGMRVFTLSNGSAATTRDFLERAGVIADSTRFCRSMSSGRGSRRGRRTTTRSPVLGCRPTASRWSQCIPGTSSARAAPG